MKIILFRHGEHKNDVLTSMGKKNVKNMAKQLKNFNISKVYVSSANRCVETAKIIAKQLKINNLILKNELNERFQLRHLPENAAEQLWWDNYMNINYVEPKNNKVGETLKQFITRNYKIFNDIIKKTKADETVLIVAHSATSYALTSYIYKSTEAQWMKIGNANYMMFEIDT